MFLYKNYKIVILKKIVNLHRIATNRTLNFRRQISQKNINLVMI